MGGRGRVCGRGTVRVRVRGRGRVRAARRRTFFSFAVSAATIGSSMGVKLWRAS